jgi:hypothetical protein
MESVDALASELSLTSALLSSSLCGVIKFCYCKGVGVYMGMRFIIIAGRIQGYLMLSCIPIGCITYFTEDVESHNEFITAWSGPRFNISWKGLLACICIMSNCLRICSYCYIPENWASIIMFI